MTSDLHPKELAAALRQAIESVRRMPMGAAARAVALDTLQGKLDEVLTPDPIVFKPLRRDYGCETWLIHPAGTEPRVYRCNLVGMSAAWLAIRDRGLSSTVRCSDLAAPGASQPATVLRKAVRETAANWVERHTGCLPLASAMRSISIDDGVLRYTPCHAHGTLITD